MKPFNRRSDHRPLPSSTDVQKSFGAVRALRSGTLSVDAGSIHALVGENGAGKSTLVKIVAGVHRRDAGEFRFQGEDVDFGSTAESKAAGIAVIYQEPTLFPDLSVTENIFMGRQPARRRPADRPGRDVRRGAGALRPARRPPRPAPPGRGPVDRRPADHRDRQGHLARRQPPRHGRADGGAQRRRGRAALRRRPQPARRGPRPRLHLAPLRRGLRALRHRHRDARRRLRLHRADRRHHRRRSSSRRMVGREVADLFPKTAAEHRRRRPRGRGPRRRPASSTTSASPSAPARSSAWPAWSAPAAARSPGPCSASTGTTPASVRLLGKPVPRRATRGPRSGPGWPSSPRTAASRASSPRARSARNVARSSGAASPRRAASPPSAENRAAGPWAGRLEVKTSALDMRAATMSGGNQQKVVLAKWLATEPAAADHRRAHPRHRRRHQGRGAPAALRPGRPGHGAS